MGSWPGLRTDCEALLRSFQEAQTVRFEEFASLWRQHRFHTVFYGKIRTPEQIKFTKEALALVWPYFLPPHTFQIRVGALYLLYGLYNTQLCQPKQKIRIALKDWPEVNKFQQELLEAQHYDAVYIFRKLQKDKAFYYTAMPKFLSFRTKKNMQDYIKTTGEFVDRSDRIALLNPDDFLEETRNVHDHYQKMKCLISRDRSKPDKALNLIKDDFVTNCKNIVEEYQEWQKNKVDSSLVTAREEMKNANEASSQESEGSGRARKLAELKSRSYSAVPQASRSRRHRQVKLECSDSRSDRGKSSSPRAKKVCRTVQPARKKDTLPLNTEMLEMREGHSVQRLSMPVIAEGGSGEEEEEEDFGDSGADVCKLLLQTVAQQPDSDTASN